MKIRDRQTSPRRPEYTSFGTRGSQVRILPLRPAFSRYWRLRHAAGYNPARTVTTGSSAPRLNGSQARGPDIREFRHEDSTLDRTDDGSCSRHWQRISGHELCLQIQPSLLVCAVFQHSTPRKSWFVRTDYRISVISDRADACGRRAEGCEHAASRVTDAQAVCGRATSPYAFAPPLLALCGTNWSDRQTESDCGCQTTREPFLHPPASQTMAPEDGRPDVVSRGAVVVTGERRIRCACGEYSGAACRHEPRIYSG